MKIKFIKPFRFIGNAPDDGSDSEVPVGHIVDLENDESTQWLIDNGFAEKAEEVKKSWWKPEEDDTYYYVRYTLSISDWRNIGYRIWTDDEDDESRYLIGNVFKTKESAQRFIDYLEAVEIVRHDEGFMKKESDNAVYPIIKDSALGAMSTCASFRQHAGEFYFDTSEHAEDSLEAHRSEWQTILNYDWGKE